MLLRNTYHMIKSLPSLFFLKVSNLLKVWNTLMCNYILDFENILSTYKKNKIGFNRWVQDFSRLL